MLPPREPKSSHRRFFRKYSLPHTTTFIREGFFRKHPSLVGNGLRELKSPRRHFFRKYSLLRTTTFVRDGFLKNILHLWVTALGSPNRRADAFFENIPCSAQRLWLMRVSQENILRYEQRQNRRADTFLGNILCSAGEKRWLEAGYPEIVVEKDEVPILIIHF